MCLGLLEDGTGQYEKAAEQFQQAVQLDPANDRAYTSLAGAYQHLNQPDKAEETYKRAIAVRPQYWRGYFFFCTFFIRPTEKRKNTRPFRRLTRLYPHRLLALTTPRAGFPFTRARANPSTP